LEWSDDKLLTVQEFQAHLGLKESAFREKLRAQELPPPIRVGGSVRWRWGTIKMWIQAVETVGAMSPGLLRAPSKTGAGAVPTAEERQNPAPEDLPASHGKKPR